MALVKKRTLRITLYIIFAVTLMGLAEYAIFKNSHLPFVFDNSGGTNSSSEYNNDYSVGQTFVEANTNSSYRNYEGFIHTVETGDTSLSMAPVANAGADITGVAGDLFILDASQSADPDGVELLFIWTQVSGLPADLSDSTAVRPEFVPEQSGIYVFELTVTDTSGLTGRDTVTVNVEYDYLAGDYNRDQLIDFEDLILFSIYWRNKDLNGDIGTAAAGETAPFYRRKVIADGKINFSDLMVFTLNWNYFSITRAYSPVKKSLPSRTDFHEEGSLKINVEKSVKSGRNIYLLTTAGRGELAGCRISITGTGLYHTGLSTELAKKSFIMLTREKKNEYEFNIVNLGKDENPFPGGTVLASFEMKKEEPVEIRYIIRDNQNKTIASAVKTYSGQETGKEVPENAVLGQNYPNPFNPETWIPFTLAEACDVKIIIYNLVGQKIREIPMGYCPAGDYTSKERAAFWNGLNDFHNEVASGIYFYKLIAGNSTKIKRMVVLK